MTPFPSDSDLSGAPGHPLTELAVEDGWGTFWATAPVMATAAPMAADEVEETARRARALARTLPDQDPTAAALAKTMRRIATVGDRAGGQLRSLADELAAAVQQGEALLASLEESGDADE